MLCLDLGKLDEFLPFTIDDTITISLQVLGAFAISIWANWFSAIVAVPMILFLIYLRLAMTHNMGMIHNMTLKGIIT